MIHLIVLHHGLWGNNTHLHYLESRIRLRFPTAEVLNLNMNHGILSYDGIDLCGDRALEFLLKRLERNDISQLSFIGYSLGGLVLRYVIGGLESEKVFERIQPMFYVSFATPHLGALRNSKTKWDRVFNSLSSILGSRTGVQLMLQDESKVLVGMAREDLVWWKGLKRFVKRVAVANVVNDRLVPLETAAIEERNGFEGNGWRAKVMNSSYPSIVQVGQEYEIMQGVGRSFAFYALSLFLLPVGLSVLSGLYGAAEWRRWREGTRARVNSRISGDGMMQDQKDEEDAKVEELDEMMTDTKAAVSVEVEEMKKEMREKLNGLQWDKVFVHASHPRAHAAIIVRSESFKGSEDAIEYVLHLLETH